MNVGIIGIGLIGGSIAKSVRSRGFASQIFGYDKREDHCTEALRLKLVDQIDDISTLMEKCDLILVTVPVNVAKELVPALLDKVKEDQYIFDFGSTKAGICESVSKHNNRNHFVATHPIAGTENTGPSAAVDNLFDEKVNIICEAEKSDKKALLIAERFFKTLKMKLLFMDAEEHDRHIAYVSHLSHISSFVLGQTVLEIEKSEENIFNMAGSGFASTVRLAKSNPNMWTPIFEQNSKHLSDALGQYIENLTQFKTFLDQKDLEKMHELMTKSNGIRRILKDIK